MYKTIRMQRLDCLRYGRLTNGIGKPFGMSDYLNLQGVRRKVLDGIEDKDLLRGENLNAKPAGDLLKGIGKEEHVLAYLHRG